MSQHGSIDQETLGELWRLTKETEAATRWQSHDLSNIYIWADDTKLRVTREKGLFSALWRFLRKKSYIIAPNTPCAELLRQLHEKTRDLDEGTFVKAISSSALIRQESTLQEVVDKIKSACRIINLLLQRVMEHKLESAQEVRQEAIKLFYSTLFLPSWGVSDARRAEKMRAYEELRHAQATTTFEEKVQGYLDAAIAQLNVAMSGKLEAEHILEQAKSARSQESLDVCAERAKECAGAALEAEKIATMIAKQAEELVKAKESAENQPIINFGEIEELKKVREIINVVGQVAEYAQLAKTAASRVETINL